MFSMIDVKIKYLTHPRTFMKIYSIIYRNYTFLNNHIYYILYISIQVVCFVFGVILKKKDATTPTNAFVLIS